MTGSTLVDILRVVRIRGATLVLRWQSRWLNLRTKYCEWQTARINKRIAKIENKTPWQDMTEAWVRILFGIFLVIVVGGYVFGEFFVVYFRWVLGK